MWLLRVLLSQLQSLSCSCLRCILHGGQRHTLGISIPPLHNGDSCCIAATFFGSISGRSINHDVWSFHIHPGPIVTFVSLIFGSNKCWTPAKATKSSPPPLVLFLFLYVHSTMPGHDPFRATAPTGHLQDWLEPCAAIDSYRPAHAHRVAHAALPGAA